MAGAEKRDRAVGLLGVLLEFLRIVAIPVVGERAESGRQIRRVRHAQGFRNDVADEVVVVVPHVFLGGVALEIARRVVGEVVVLERRVRDLAVAGGEIAVIEEMPLHRHRARDRRGGAAEAVAVEIDAGLPRGDAGEKRSARGRAGRDVGIRVREPRAARGEPLDVRRVHRRVVQHAGQIRRVIVDDNEKDVGPGGRFRGRGGDGCEAGASEEGQGEARQPVWRPAQSGGHGESVLLSWFESVRIRAAARRAAMRPPAASGPRRALRR